MRSDNSSAFRLTRLRLENFRSFQACELDLRPDLTVLVAENGQGKTALLEAIAIAFDAIFAPITNRKRSTGFARTDIRRIQGEGGFMIPQPSVSFFAKGSLAGREIGWSRTLDSSKKARTDWGGLKELESLLDEWSSDLQQKNPSSQTFPLAVYYGTSRVLGNRDKSARNSYDRPDHTRSSAYANALSSTSSFADFAAWYEGMMKRIRFTTQANFHLVAQIAAVRTAINEVLRPTDWSNIDWVFPEDSREETNHEPGYLSVEHPTNGKLPVSLLSDGVRNMIAMVADLAYRCVLLNPHLRGKAALETPGILLVDEIDLHLHPRWQQLVVESLRNAFPCFQLVLSTHSPHLLSTVAVESIRVIGSNSRISTPDYQTLGNESADILARTMGVNPTPQVEEAQWLSAYRGMVDAGAHQSNEGEELWQKVLQHYGEDHGAIQEIHVLRSLHEFKQSHPEFKK